MPQPSDREIFRRWNDRPANLLPILHAFHERDGYLSDEALKEISRACRIPLAELFGTVSFYHHLSRSPGGAGQPRVCTGPVCHLKGGTELLQQLAPQEATAMPCAGRCDEPIPVIMNDRVLVGLSAKELCENVSPLPPLPVPETRECVFDAIREPGRSTLPGYRRTGGYRALEKVLSRLKPRQLIEVVQESGLAGRGGAGFPTGVKWKAVLEAPGTPKTIVCNADEGEPGCFKDRALLDHDPHAVIEGMLLAALATGAERGFIYLRYEYPATWKRLQQALQEARAEQLLGARILDSDFEFDIFLRRGAGAYICGEEGSLLNSLEGKHPFPRNRPPFPVTHGYQGLPTVVNNVETLASVPPIVLKGAEWYRSLGLGNHAGTKVISLSGDIRRPGNYEVPLGLSLQTLLEWAGGALDGHSIQAVTMAGLSGGFLGAESLSVTLDESSIRAHGSFLGAGGIMVFDERRDMVEVARQAMAFFAEESCGKCFPCRIGTQRLTERLGGEAGPDGLADWVSEVEEIGRTMKATSACGLGMAAPLITESLLKYFPNQVADSLRASGVGQC